MRWFQVDEARDMLTRNGGKRVSRKVVYGLVRDGLRVARHGRRIWFCETWLVKGGGKLDHGGGGKPDHPAAGRSS